MRLKFLWDKSHQDQQFHLVRPDRIGELRLQWTSPNRLILLRGPHPKSPRSPAVLPVTFLRATVLSLAITVHPKECHQERNKELQK